jgi:methionyl-tRNA formyltransferase
MAKPLKIAFMGSPDFAVPSLTALFRSQHEVVSVITQPDRPKGRGCKLCCTQVKACALDLDIETFQPDSVKTDHFLTHIRNLEVDVIAVVAYGQILPPALLDTPRLGAINVHASLLPKYRGPAPIHWAIINREKETGVTTMVMDSGCDTGDILLTSRTAIEADDTAQTLHDRLSEMGATLLVRTLDELATGRLHPRPQDHTKATYAPLLNKQDGKIDWKQPALDIEAFIRGMTPWPGAFTLFGDKRVKIFKAAALPMATPQPPGTVLAGFADELRVATGNGILSILELQVASAKRLPIKEYLMGCRMRPGTIFS